MAKALKQMLASQLENTLEDSSGLLVIDTGPMAVELNRAFRADLREKAGGARMRVLHNRTARVALGSMGVKDQAGDLKGMLRGPSAVIYGGDGPIATAKVVREWVKKHKTLVVKGAVTDGELMNAADAAGLADMPDLNQLRGMLAGLLQASARGLAVSIQAVYGGIARSIQARVDKHADGGAAGDAQNEGGGSGAATA